MNVALATTISVRTSEPANWPAIERLIVLDMMFPSFILLRSCTSKTFLGFLMPVRFYLAAR